MFLFSITGWWGLWKGYGVVINMLLNYTANLKHSWNDLQDNLILDLLGKCSVNAASKCWCPCKTEKHFQVTKRYIHKNVWTICTIKDRNQSQGAFLRLFCLYGHGPLLLVRPLTPAYNGPWTRCFHSPSLIDVNGGTRGLSRLRDGFSKNRIRRRRFPGKSNNLLSIRILHCKVGWGGDSASLSTTAII